MKRMKRHVLYVVGAAILTTGAFAQVAVKPQPSSETQEGSRPLAEAKPTVVKLAKALEGFAALTGQADITGEVGDKGKKMSVPAVGDVWEMPVALPAQFVSPSEEAMLQLVGSGSSQCLRENSYCRQACGTGRSGAARCRARCDGRLQDCLNGGGGDQPGPGWPGPGGGGSQCLRQNSYCRQACGTGRSGAARCRARCDAVLQDCLND